MHLISTHFASSSSGGNSVARERERDRDRDRQTDRETDRQTDRERHTHTHRQTDRQTETERYDVMYVKALEQLKYFYLLISNIIHLKVCH